MAKTKIVYAVEMLHYLPLYLAHERYLSHEFDIELAPAPYGDRSAIESLMSTLTRHEHVDFCVCDPMMVNLAEAYSAASGDWPVAIAQLIQKVPFWAVDHKNPNFSEEDKFTQFNQIFAYPRPNTGYVFGKLIYERCSKLRGSGLQLREKPIDAELDFYLTDAGSVVIEADILKIRKYEENTQNTVVFSYPLHPKYSQFCFTALITRRNFLRKPEGKVKAHKLIHALQKAAYQIYNDHTLALQSANARFSAKGFQPDVIDGALKQLAEQQVFSRSLIVNYRGWQKSVYIQKQVDQDFKYPPYRKFVDNRIPRKEHRNSLKKQTDRSSYWLIRNIADYPLLTRAAEIMLSLGWLLFPAFLIGWKNMLTDPKKPMVMWALFHFILTALVLAIYSFRGRLTAALKLDPAGRLVHAVAITIPYLVADTTIVVELVRAIATD